MAIEVDLYSDTVTRPTPAMRRAMAEAEVGDEQLFEDPTVRRLQDRVAELLGKDAALFLPSGTMANQISIRAHTRPGDELIAHRTAHPIHFESGGIAGNAGVQVRPVDGPRGQYDAAAAEAAVRADWREMPRSRLLWVEQTSNLGGGSIWPLQRIAEVTAVARRHGLATHLDGARLLNAVVASGVAANAWAAPFDSVWIDFTKGLGAPIGACLAGSAAFIEDAWRFKQQMGGAMRQAGIVAAAGLYALDHHVDRLADDHARARRLAEAFAALPGVSVHPAAVDTNIVLIELTGTFGADEATARFAERGVRLSSFGLSTLRAVTHLDVDDTGIDRAIEAARAIFG
ncbi:MAG TPA: GntG family PLP-dependent aldolase [Candidatus Limnocylindrales bacterium]|jgi:threonine aldolase